MSMLSKELEFTLNQAFKEARDRRHEFMTVEHLLLHLHFVTAEHTVFGDGGVGFASGFEPHVDEQGFEMLGGLFDALRVVDSSIFPTIPNGNLNSPTIMLAERMADLIRR